MDGQVVTIPATSAQGKLEAVLERLAGSVFTKAEYVDTPMQSLQQVNQALADRIQMGLAEGAEPNAHACEEMGRYLDVRDRTH